MTYGTLLLVLSAFDMPYAVFSYALTDQRHNLHHHQPVSSCPALSKQFHFRASKWQEQWEQTDSNLERCNIHPNERLPSGHTLPWRAWRTANRVRSGQAATPAAKHLWGYRESKTCMCGAATCDLKHIMTSCTHFGERPSVGDIAEMKDGYVRCGDRLPLQTRHDDTRFS